MNRGLQTAAIAWLVTAVYYFYQYTLRSAPAVMMPQLSEAFSLDALGVASMVGLFYYGYSPFSLVAGVAMDQLGPRKVIPIGAALYHDDGRLLGCGHNRRIQENDPSVHGETDAFRKAGRQRRYRDTIMVTTLAPCWYCSGLVRQFNVGTVVVGESVNFRGGIDWLREHGVNVIDLNDGECVQMLGDWIAANPDVWNEDIGED